MKMPLLFITFLIFSTFSNAQPSTELEENKSVVIDGIEIGYRINKESTKKSGGDEYSRYILNFYAINKSGCSFHYYLKNNDPYYTSSEDNLIATFYIRNANGKRWTNTKAAVNAKQIWWVPVKANQKDSQGKDITVIQNMEAGYIFRKGEQISNDNIVVLVPLGEKPKVEVVLKYNPYMD